MIFISRNTSAELSLTTPPVCCCNCGAAGPLEFVETPMKRIRYFFVFGTELTLTEHFPYCTGCKKSAGRLRQGWLGKTVTACLLTAVLFLVYVLAADALPKMMSENLFRSSAISAVALTLVWFYKQEWSRKGRTYYQPVRLGDVDDSGGGLQGYTLKFSNARYGDAIAEANRDLMLHGILRVETDAT
jgi:hypothetical protein